MIDAKGMTGGHGGTGGQHETRPPSTAKVDTAEDFHRILSGSPLTKGQLTAAGLFVLVWFLMDLVQFIDMIVGWMK